MGIPEEIGGFRRTAVHSKDLNRIKAETQNFRARGLSVMQRQFGTKIYLYIKDDKKGELIKDGEELQHDGPGSEDSL